MKALVYEGPRNMHVREIPEPCPKADQVKIRIRYCSICGSDVHGYTGASGRRIPPMIMGHEASGIVAAVGRNVKSVRPGDRAAIQPIDYCGHCELCRAGKTEVCRNRRGLGVMDVNGAFAEYVCVSEKQAVPIPETLDFMQASLIEPTSVAYHAVRQLLPVEGKTVFVAGAGVIGILVVKWLKYFRCKTVIISGLSEEKLEIAKRQGADIAFDPRKTGVRQILEENGLKNGVDIAVECVGATPTVGQTVESVAINGTIMWIGNAARMVQVDMQKIVTSEVKIMGTYGFSDGDFADVARILAEGTFEVRSLISKTVPLEEAVDEFEELANGRDVDLKILVRLSD